MHGPGRGDFLDDEGYKEVLRLARPDTSEGLNRGVTYNIPDNLVTVVLVEGLEVLVTGFGTKREEPEISLTNPGLPQPRHLLILAAEVESLEARGTIGLGITRNLHRHIHQLLRNLPIICQQLELLPARHFRAVY